ncbi:MAG: hypothetical protein M0P69_14365 [Bacteroidales bacterium]|nr:hypothetical protein [Bacteroidales bacterium]MDD2813337.1 hypothetical protein [Bacteroidales bacterium]MDD3386250.1 hypothetical protein [Bacteroidales bacterium]MDD4811672.1 hypothetical protein [Bacteroidales bacterium]
MFKKRIQIIWNWIFNMIRYNLKVIFAGKFIWFLLASLGFFVIVLLITLFSGNTIHSGVVYELLLYPGLLLVFYPTVFGIQNDEDTRILEILFGIPNYRYKIWLVRLILIYFVVFLILLLLAMFGSWAIVDFSVFNMAWHLMFPIFFMGTLAFLLSTFIKNGIGTGVVLIIIGVFFLILADAIARSKWNLFLNPFTIPDGMSETAWKSIVQDNRIILFVGMILSLLGGLTSLQKRERFI